MMAGRPAPMSWVEYIDQLGFLERALAITGGPAELEYLLGALFSFRPETRLGIKQLLATPMFARVIPNSVPATPRLAWTQKTSRRHLDDVPERMARKICTMQTAEPRNLRLLFTANCMYSQCREFVGDDVLANKKLYIACVGFAHEVHGVKYQRSNMLGNANVNRDAADYNQLEALILMTCIGHIDQETAYERSPRLTYSSEIIGLYMDDFTG